MASTDYALLADVRHSLRALNGVIEAGAKAAGLTVQQQGFLLSLAARGGTHVPLADLRADLGMDQATTSELLGRLGRRGWSRAERGSIDGLSTSRSLGAGAGLSRSQCGRSAVR